MTVDTPTDGQNARLESCRIRKLFYVENTSIPIFAYVFQNRAFPRFTFTLSQWNNTKQIRPMYKCLFAVQMITNEFEARHYINKITFGILYNVAFCSKPRSIGNKHFREMQPQYYNIAIYKVRFQILPIQN